MLTCTGNIRPLCYRHTVSSYLSLVAHALASLTFLPVHNDRTNSIMFALFDSQLDRLELPVFRPPYYQEQDGQSPRLEAVSGLVQKYFEWVCIFDKPDCEEAGERKNRLRLYNTRNPSGDHSTMLCWVEHDGPKRGSSEGRGTVFCW